MDEQGRINEEAAVHKGLYSIAHIDFVCHASDVIDIFGMRDRCNYPFSSSITNPITTFIPVPSVSSTPAAAGNNTNTISDCNDNTRISSPTKPCVISN